MRRDPPQPERVRRIWPIFGWRHCIGCAEEFRREAGWHVDLPIGGKNSHYVSASVDLCADCAPSEEDAVRIFWRYRSAPPPPVPGGIG